ncbi:MAG: hypothetical protein JWM62_2272 [Frankiales bacterium]|jgi:hypothetical protein|nr:hypothetical protein [Frankiales bacterium]
MTTTTRTLDVGLVPAARTSAAGPLLLRPLRLQLRSPQPPGVARGLVDGAWWPYSDDLVAELGSLLEGVAQRGHRVHRVSYSLDAWTDVPRKVLIGGTLVRLGGYRTQHSSVLHLIDSSGKAPLVLVVIPTTATQDVAQRASELAVTSTLLDAGRILDAATS